jgi:hypothetical protein
MLFNPFVLPGRLFVRLAPLLLICVFSAPPVAAQQLGLMAFAERSELSHRQGARVFLSFDLDRRVSERALAVAPVVLSGDELSEALETSESQPEFRRLDALVGPKPPIEPAAGDLGGVGELRLSQTPSLRILGETVVDERVAPLAIERSGGETASKTLRIAQSGAATEPTTQERAVPTQVAAPSRVNAGGQGAKRRWSTAFLTRLIQRALAGQKRTLAALDAVRERARMAGWLPVLTLRAGRNSDRSLRLSPTDTDPDRWQLTGGSDLRLEAQVSWDLDRLAFAPEEVALERLRVQQAESERLLTKRVLELAFRWQKAHAALATVRREEREELLPDEELSHWLEQSSAEAELDVLSGAWFSAHLHEAWRPEG